MPKSAGAGLSVRLTLLPEWRPIPTQETCRRSVCCASIANQAKEEKRTQLSKVDARRAVARSVSIMRWCISDLAVANRQRADSPITVLWYGGHSGSFEKRGDITTVLIQPPIVSAASAQTGTGPPGSGRWPSPGGPQPPL